MCRGYTDIVDADLSKYFDTIPHADLLQSVARRIVDRNVLWLIKHGCGRRSGSAQQFLIDGARRRSDATAHLWRGSCVKPGRLAVEPQQVVLG